MAVVIACIHPVSIHGAEILHLQLDQTACQLLLESEVRREGIGFELEFAGEDVHEEFHNGISWRQSVGEENKPNDDWMRLVESKGGIERVVIDEDTEEGEDIEHVELKMLVSDTWYGEYFGAKTYLGNSEELGGMR